MDLELCVDSVSIQACVLDESLTLGPAQASCCCDMQLMYHLSFRGTMFRNREAFHCEAVGYLSGSSGLIEREEWYVKVF